MKRLWLAGLAFGAMLAVGGIAAADEISVGVAGSDDRRRSDLRAPAQERRRTSGRRHQCGGEGVLGKQLKLEIIGDDACDPKQARSIGEKFGGEKLPVVVGHYCSSSSIPASEAYAEGGTLQITPASTNPTFTERGLWNTFRVCGRDDQQGAVAGDYIAKNFKGKNIAILQDK